MELVTQTVGREASRELRESRGSSRQDRLSRGCRLGLRSEWLYRSSCDASTNHYRGRGPEIEGTRITVYDIFEYLRADWHPTAIAGLFRLSSHQVQAAVNYIASHQVEVEAVYQQIMERINQGNPPALQEKFKASQARLRTKLRTLHNWETDVAQHSGGQ